MDKITKFLGIDVSKEVLDVSASDGKHFQFYNDPSGDQKLIALLDLQGHCVMEATACCHQSLETWLCTKVMLSVVNPPN